MGKYHLLLIHITCTLPTCIPLAEFARSKPLCQGVPTVLPGGRKHERGKCQSCVIACNLLIIFCQREFRHELRHEVACCARGGTARTRNGEIAWNRVDDLTAGL